MKKYIIVIIAVFYSLLCTNMLFAAANPWTPKADFGWTARDSAVGFSIDSKGYIGTGWDGSYYRDFWMFDAATNAWTQMADFGGTKRYWAVGFSIGSKGYIGMGEDGSYTKDFWEYNPATNAWTPKADFGGTGRIASVGFSIGSKGYIGTGYNNGSYYKDFWEYDPAGDAGAGTWSQKTDFPGTARYVAVGFSIGAKGYIGTGLDDSSYTKDFWEYDPAGDAGAGTWSRKADFQGTARSDAVGFSIGSKGYIGTGWDGSSYTKDFWEYGPTGNTWTRKTDFGGTARGNAVGFSIGSKGYIGTGGDDSSYKKDFWEYDPSATTGKSLGLPWLLLLFGN